jgi:hypothetical protein
MSNPLNELKTNPEFMKIWPALFPRLERYFLAKQREHAKKHPGEHEEIGRFVAFTAEILDDFEKLNVEAIPQKPKHKPLNRAPL